MKILTTEEKLHFHNYLQSRTTYKDDCWIYNGFKHGNNYKGLWFGNKRVLAHRLSAAIFLNLDLDNKDLQANHKSECQSKFCWNPDHLYIGTQAENMKDVAKAIKGTNNLCKTCGGLRTLVASSSRGKRILKLTCNTCKLRRYHRNKK